MPAGTPQLAVRVLPAAKPAWKSRTLWLNLLAWAFALAELTLGPNVSPTTLAALLAGLAAANFVLRTRTDRAVSVRDPDAPEA